MREGDVSVALPVLARWTVGLPLAALVICLMLSIGVDFEKATYTHCEVPQFAPSISAVIGGFSPQTYIWKIAIALSSAPGFLFARLYHRFYRERLTLGPNTHKLISLNFLLNTLENLSLVGLSFVPSDDIFVVHEVFFITFLLTSMLSQLLTSFYFHSRCGFQPRSQAESLALHHKRLLAKITLGAAAMALYFYWRHNEYCEPYVYSFFGLCEYCIVVCNILYHGLISYDLSDHSVRTGPDLVLLK